MGEKSRAETPFNGVISVGVLEGPFHEPVGRVGGRSARVRRVHGPTSVSVRGADRRFVDTGQRTGPGVCVEVERVAEARKVAFCFSWEDWIFTPMRMIDVHRRNEHDSKGAIKRSSESGYGMPVIQVVAE